MPSTTIDYIKVPKVERKNVHTFTLHPLDIYLHTLMKIYCPDRKNILYKMTPKIKCQKIKTENNTQLNLKNKVLD